MIHLIDTGPLVAAFARNEPKFGPWARELIRALPPPLYTCEPVITEAAHLLGTSQPILSALADKLLLCPWRLSENESRVLQLTQKYLDQPMDLADACLVAMSEQFWECRLITIDVADFHVYRRRGRHSIPLLTPP